MKRKAVLRRRESHAASSFDQQLWPIQIALIVFAAFALGVARAWTGWNEPTVFRNTAFWFVLISILVTLSLWGVSKLPPRRFRRTAILASVLSLLINLSLFVVVAWIQIFAPIPTTEQPRRSMDNLPSPIVTLDFDLQVYEDQVATNPLDQPIQTDHPEDLATAAEEQEPTEADLQEFTAPTERSETDQAIVFDRPLPSRRETAVQPRESITPGPLRRDRLARSQQTVPTPPNLQRVMSASKTPDGTRRSAATQVLDEQPDSQPTRISQSRVSQTLDVERERGDARSEPVTERTRELTRAARETEDLGLTSLPPLAKKRDLKNLPRDATVEPLESPDATTAPMQDEVAQRIAEATPTDVRKSESQAEMTTPHMNFELDAELTRGPLDAVAHSPKRIEHSDVPAADAFEKPSTVPRQVLRVAQIPQSPREISSRTLASSSTESGEPIPDAARMAVSQSEMGIAGLGETRNFSELPRETMGEATTPADFAKRSEPSQREDQDHFLSPSEVVPLPRVPSRQSKSTTSVAAASAATSSSLESATEPQESLAAAKLEPMASQATGREGVGDVGAAPLDMGPPRYTGSGMERKSGGGGEPMLSQAPIPLPRANLRSGGVPRVAIPATEVAISAAAPQGTGGGSRATESLSTEIQPDASSFGLDAQSSTSPSSLLSQTAEGKAQSLSINPGPAKRGGALGGSGPTEVANAPRQLKRRTPSAGQSAARVEAEVASVSGLEHSSGRENASSTGNDGSRALDTMIGRSESSSSSPGDVDTGEQNHGEDSESLTTAAEVSSTESAQQGSIRWEVASEIGLAGMGGKIPGRPGLDDPRADLDGESVAPLLRRFQPRQTKELPKTSSRVAISKDAFKKRMLRNSVENAGGEPSGRSTKTEAAIEAGLGYLARIQQSDGHWELQLADATKSDNPTHDPQPGLRSNTAATGLALLSFLGAGYHHQDDPYREVVRRGLNYLIAHQAESGDLYEREDETSNLSVALYSHGIAALAMSEAYGMTQDPDLKDSAQRGLDFISASQCEPLGGWRYAPGSQSDTSVSGWMTMALKSGELAGLDVDSRTYRGIEQWLDQAQASEERPHLYRYNPYAPDTAQQRHGKFASPTMTSVGLLMRLYGGWRREHPAMQAGADYLSQNLPTSDSYGDARRNTYYWYYATQVMFHMGGSHWKQWNDKLHPLLIDSQIVDGENSGSWHPRNPVPDRWGAQAGRLYVTTLNLLSLEVYYRHLPLYEGTLADDQASAKGSLGRPQNVQRP